MRFYNNQHPYYCGIDLHARQLYVCIIDESGAVLTHQNIQADSAKLLLILEPYSGNIVVGVECMHCWYWVADQCEENGIDFVLAHALYMKAIHGGKAKNDRIDSAKIAQLLRGGNFPLAYHYPQEMRATRDLRRRRLHIVRHGAELKAHVKNTASQYNLPAITTSLRDAKNREALRDYFPQKAVQRSVDLDLDLVDYYHKKLHEIEWFVLKSARQHNAQDYELLKTIPGVGKILALTILYEIGSIDRFESVGNFASYCRLIKCKADDCMDAGGRVTQDAKTESAGKSYGSQGNKIGNAHLKWAFSEAAVLYLKGNPEAKAYLAKLQKRMSKAKALSALAHKLGRCVYFMLKRKTVFDQKRMLGS